ncbi:MAG: U32 family peptidase [Ignavibacteria bacterium]|nr:U32 family peptidase [Ignavibacteria bacterium]
MEQKNRLKQIELLSPAKDLAGGIAAVNCGADAVYIGAPKFGARSAAGNSLQDIDKLVQYAHQYWAKVYVTVNTILYDDELDEAQKLICQLYEAGVDAVIIQDMAVLEMDLPPIPLFASTQTNNYSIEKIKFLEQSGLQRIILARELSFEQIKEIKLSTNVDLEFFIHGALCVSYSGQCYFSFATTGRSANRGECSQACRMLYSLEDSNWKIIKSEAYLLSLKDLNLSAHLRSLIDAGITSFKIEGRLKDVHYVKNITAYYRQKLDELLLDDTSIKKASSGKIIYSFIPDPEKTFNRGYTEYFLSGGGKEIASLATPKSVGKLIGKVKNIGKDFFEIETKEYLVNGDGICFFDEQDILTGTNINHVERNRIFTKELSGLLPGTEIYRNHDHQFIKELSKDETKRKIACEIEVQPEENKLIISATDEDGNKVSFSEAVELIEPEDAKKAIAVMENQLKKSGSTIFSVESVRIKSGKAIFLPVSKWNELRRTILQLLLEERIKNYPMQKREHINNSMVFPENKLNYAGNVVNEKAKEFYRKHGVETIEDGFEKLDDFEGKILMTTKYCIKEELHMCPFKSEHTQIHAMKEPLYLNDGKQKYRLHFNCQKCEMEIYF